MWTETPASTAGREDTGLLSAPTKLLTRSATAVAVEDTFRKTANAASRLQATDLLEKLLVLLIEVALALPGNLHLDHQSKTTI